MLSKLQGSTVSTWMRRSSIISSNPRTSSDGSDSILTPPLSETPLLADDRDSIVQELDFYYGLVKRQVLNYQSLTTGLFPAVSSDTRVGSIRDSLYCCMVMWAVYLGYKRIDEVKGKAFEMRQSCVAGLQGILACWMQQAAELESFKKNQSEACALHVLFDLDTGRPVKSVGEYGHLQLDVVALYLLVLAQSIESGLEIMSNIEEVSFVQNLVFYVERAYRTTDYGMWERGSAYNNGTCEINASSIAMAKAALEALNGFNLFGKHGTSSTSIYVDVDAHNRNRMILETLLPRESNTKSADASLLPAISFPAFATHNEKLYKVTKSSILKKLSGSGDYGLKRFIRDGYGCVLEPQGQRLYHPDQTKDFESIECEWPLFYAYLIIDGVFVHDQRQVVKYQKLLKERICYSECGDPLLPKYYYVTRDNIDEERAMPGSTARKPSSEGSSSSNLFLWGQCILILADLLTSKLVSHVDLDPISRRLPPHLRKQPTRNVNFESLRRNDVTVQLILIAESSQLQVMLNTYGIETQTPEEIEPVQIWSQWDMVKVFSKQGQNKKLKISGRPDRPIGVLGTSKFYRVRGQMVLCYPLTFSASDFYLSNDLGMLTSDVRSDLKFLSQRWRIANSRPTYCILITENNMKDMQFYELLDLLMELRMLKLEGVKLQLGRLQNLIATGSVETLDYTNHMDLSDLKFEPFQQTHHMFLGYNVFSERNALRPKVEEKIDFVTRFKDKSSEEITSEILKLGHMHGRIQLLGILLKRHGNEHVVNGTSVVNRLQELNREAASVRYWVAVRYSASLLGKMVDSISPYVTQILVSGKQVTVGTIGASYQLFRKPMTPAEIRDAIYTRVQPYNTIGAVLQQELILFCGKLIVSNPELFSGIIKVRIGWVLRALEVYHAIASTNEGKPVEPIEDLSPSKVRKLVTDVLTQSQIIKLSFEKSSKQHKLEPCSPTGPPTADGSRNNKGSSWATPLTVYQARQISGCLSQTPSGFYNDVWLVLQRAPRGINIKKHFLPQQPTLSNLSGMEELFAHEVENLLNDYEDPVRKHLVIEFLSVVATVLKRHPELHLVETLDVQNLIDRSVEMYKKDRHLGPEEDAEAAFMHLSVSTTGVFFVKAVVNYLLHETNLMDAVEKAATSSYECPVQ